MNDAAMRTRRTRSYGRRLVLLSIPVAVIACASRDAAVAPSGDAHTFFQTFTVHEPAVNLSLTSLDDTARVHVTAQFADGASVPTQILYTTDDTTITVDSTGLIRAQLVTDRAAVVHISASYGGLTRRDSVRVQVRDTPPVMRVQRVSVLPADGVTTEVPILDTVGNPGSQQLRIAALDANGDSVPDVLLSIRSLDTTVVKVDAGGFMTARRPGTGRVVVTTVVHGAILSDSITFRIGQTMYGGFDIHGPTDGYQAPTVWRFAPGNGDTIHVAVNGVVGWTAVGTTTVSVVFDDSTSVLGATVVYVFTYPPNADGNIHHLGAGTVDPNTDLFNYWDVTNKARRFPKAGVYHFRVVVEDASGTQLHGTVIACDHHTIPCPLDQ